MFKEIREVARRQLRARALSRKIDAAVAPQASAAAGAGSGASGRTLARSALSMRLQSNPFPPGSVNNPFPSGGGVGVEPPVVGAAGGIAYPTLQQRR